jgi:hypothetical protein
MNTASPMPDSKLEGDLRREKEILLNLCFSFPIRGAHFGSSVGIAAASSLPELRLRSNTSKRNAFLQGQGRNNSVTNLSEVRPKGRASEHPGESESRLEKIATGS